MRLNKLLAERLAISRRTADAVIDSGHVTVNGSIPKLGSPISEDDLILYKGEQLPNKLEHIILMLNKPTGYVSSKNGQGSQTVYDLLPSKFNSLKTVGRLDKDSTGLILLTNDGDLANRLTHPRYQKEKQYIITLDKPISAEQIKVIENGGVTLSDGVSILNISKADNRIVVKMKEGRNRQIRRTFNAIGLNVTSLHRTQFGNYSLGDLGSGKYKLINS